MAKVSNRHTESTGLWNDIKTLRWAVVPSSALKILLIPVVLWGSWELLQPFVGKDLANPFSPLLFISCRIPDSTPDDPRYQKGYLDLVFIAYYMVFWSFVRQSILIYIARPLARAYRVRKKKIDRVGEQIYAIIYWGFNGLWGIRIMSQLPTWWYETKYFWIDYPHWEMIPELKRYYLMQAAYWCHQLLVVLLGLEKPRIDYRELVAHHFITLWLVGWSYLVNLTLIGNAVFVSMDIPDTFLGLSLLFNYLQYTKTKIAIYAVFMVIWTYFRHYLNINMLWSVLYEFHLMPEYAKVWSPKDGWWMVWWMQYQVFVPLLFLQFLNVFWYALMWRVAYRALFDHKKADMRSEDEDDGQPDEENDKED